ncbi:MAG: protein kinase domain-containing protein [Thermodesulfovibrionales bacterium]
MSTRRKYERFDDCRELEFFCEERSFRGTSLNFSNEGCSLLTDNEFSPDMVVYLLLQLRDRTFCRPMGIIRWVTYHPEGRRENRLGIEIIDADDKYLEFISGLVGGSRDNTAEAVKTAQAGEPAAGTAHPETVLIICPNCRVKNRIPAARISANPKCGRCGSPLGPGAVSEEAKREVMETAVSEGGEASAGPRQPERRAYRPGDLIAGRYQVQEIFGGEGKSAMGVVYNCFDLQQGRAYALKTLQDKFLDSERTVDSFRKEGLAWIHLGKHPHILRAYWVRELDHRMFIACEFINPDGDGNNSLTPHLKRPFSLKKALTWAIQICFGMEYACSRGVTPHRDIKPDNIMVTMDGDVKIADFGLAGLFSKTDQSGEIRHLMEDSEEGQAFLHSAKNRIIAGSPPWMAPEQFYGVAETSSDIYSFGIVLFQMVSKGELPFQPRKGVSWRTVHKEYPVPPIPWRGKVLSDIINKCLQKRRDKRYQDFAQLREDLEEIFRQEITRETGEKPPEPPLVEGLREAELINKGMSMTNLGLIDEGIRNYREGLRLNPHNAEAHYNLANALIRKGQVREAIASYRQAIRVDPDLTAAHFNLGVALFNSGKTDEAIVSYKEAARTDPSFAEAYVNLGVALHKKGLLAKALAAFEEFIRHCPPDDSRLEKTREMVRKLRGSHP